MLRSSSSPTPIPEVGAKIAVIGKFRNNGQVCIAPSRFYVHKDVQKKFTEAAVEFAKALKIGNGLDAGIEVGPMFEKKAMEATMELVDDARKNGAKVLTGGKRSDRFDRGYFFEPTVLTGLSADAKMHDRGAVRPGDAAARFQQARRGDRGRQQHALRPGGLRVHQRSDGRLEDGRRASRPASSASTTRCRRRRSARSAA